MNRHCDLAPRVSVALDCPFILLLSVILEIKLFEGFVERPHFCHHQCALLMSVSTNYLSLPIA